MKNNKKVILWIGVILLIACVSAFGAWAYSAEHIDVNKTIPCIEVNTQVPVDVVVSGTYCRYKYRDDHFTGTIRIPELRECTREYVFENDEKSYFTDEAGQPMGTIIQGGIFDTLEITENNYHLNSK